MNQSAQVLSKGLRERTKENGPSQNGPAQNGAKEGAHHSNLYTQQGTIGFSILANIVTVVGVVAMNKHIQTRHRFPFMVALSAMHFIFTGTLLRILLALNVFEFKHAKLKYVVSKAALDCASVAFMNISLSHNSVGTFQLSKLCCIPVTVAVQYVCWKKSISANTAHALFWLCVGIGIATVTDVHITAVGTMWATVAILATVFSQILTNLYLNDLGCDALQLLYHTSPWISLGMIVMIPLLEDLTGPSGLLNYSTTPSATISILISCVFAFSVNITNYFVLGKTSALTYQVTGHLKTILTLIIGYTVFDRDIIPKNLLGVCLTLAGMMAYVHIRSAEASGQAKSNAAAVWILYIVAALALVTWPFL